MNKSSLRRAPSLIWAIVLLLGCAFTLPVLPYLWTAANTEAASLDATENNPRANFWRSVRTGTEGYTAIRGTDADVLINNSGQNWRQFRMRILAPYGGLMMAAVVFIIAVFYALRGPIRFRSDGSEELVLRFSVYQRVIHWFTAILFWILALTGLILLYGRFVLIPLFGSSGFALSASASKEAHNLFGPIFIVALILMTIGYALDNFYQKGDLAWLLKGGGMLGRHASAGRFNFGEKIWFWLVLICGTAISISGMILDFSILGFGRNTLEMAHVFHGVAALILISAAFGHVYLGTVGTKGTLRGMTTGYVEQSWAKVHHDRWLTELSKSPEHQSLQVPRDE
ncbi:MAG: formate dehydrogenase subunit gamma [bacterium]